MTSILSLLTTFIIHTISTLGYPGIILLMAFHSAAIPVPSEIVVPFSGFLVSEGRFNLIGVIISATVGNLLGASVIYYVALHGGRQLLEKYGKWLLISPHDIRMADRFFERFGTPAVIVGRCIPIVATFISIPAALAKVKYWKFLLATCFGALLWNTVLAIVGLQLGQHWLELRDRLRGYEIFVAIIIVLGLIFWIWRHTRHLKQH